MGVFCFAILIKGARIEQGNAKHKNSPGDCFGARVRAEEGSSLRRAILVRVTKTKTPIVRETLRKEVVSLFLYKKMTLSKLESVIVGYALSNVRNGSTYFLN